MNKNLSIVYELNKPHGIRDSHGYLFFFTKIQHWPGQDERYRKEVEEQFKLADFLLSSLQGRAKEQGEPKPLPTTKQGSEPSEILQELEKAVAHCREGCPKFAIVHIEAAAKLLPLQ